MHPLVETALNHWRGINSRGQFWARISIEQFENSEPRVLILVGPRNQVPIGQREYYTNCDGKVTFIDKVWG